MSEIINKMIEIFTAPIVINNWILPFDLWSLLKNFLILLLLVIMGSTLLKFLRKKVMRSPRFSPERSEQISKWAKRIIRVLVLLGFLLILGTLFDSQIYGTLRRFMELLNTPIVSSGNTRISAITLFLLIPMFALASWIGRRIQRILESRVFHKMGLGREKASTFGRLSRYIAMTLAFLFGLSIIGVDLSVLGVLFGVLGIGIGFGLQGLVADFFAGLSLIGMGVIKEGDRIRLGTYDGTIKYIRLMNTELITFENESLIIPNNQITQGIIHNLSYRDKRVVILNEVEVDYSSDLEQVISILEQVAGRNPWRESTEKILVRVKSFNSSGIALLLRTWISSVAFRGEAISWTNLEIWRAFREENITIPFPQQVIHFQKDVSENEETIAPDINHSPEE